MNRLTVADYINNRGSYLANGRSSAGNAAQKAARNEALAKKIDELVDSGMSRSEAKSEADRWIKTQAALHDPDQIAGGFPKNVTGVGDFGINSSIGAQWKDKIAGKFRVKSSLSGTPIYSNPNNAALCRYITKLGSTDSILAFGFASNIVISWISSSEPLPKTICACLGI